MDEDVSLLQKAVCASEIKRVAIVDDVFDTPSMEPANMGSLLDFLQNNHTVRIRAGIKDADWGNAIRDIRDGEHESPYVAQVLEQLYEKYVDSEDNTYDPAGLFRRTRDANLAFLRPLLEFLSSCESLILHKFGSATPAITADEMPDLVLVDLFLNPAISPVDLPNPAEATAAVEMSMDRIRPLLDKEPAIILMSSHGERGKREADNYRANLNDRIYGSRFGFVNKGEVTKTAELGLKVEVGARETLLDIFQTYKFGKALTEAMTRWLKSAKDAVDTMGKDVRSLQLKEIAYLIQFRLAAEGQGLEEYLEWFFGEALLDYIIRAADDAHGQNPLELAFDPAAVSGIDGGFEPTTSVAKMYHRVRVESVRKRPRKNFRLGDLYLDKINNQVVAVMTPDCDLVLRRAKNGEARNASHLLLVPGKISDLEKISASVGDFLIIRDTPHNIQWTYKKVFSLPFSGTLEKAGQEGDDYEYLGTLRPLYAQEIQANLLNHVGRVGVAVPPVIGFPAVATIVVRTLGGIKELSAHGTTFDCSLVLGRASDQKTRVVFNREVIRKIKAALVEMPVDGLIPGSAGRVEALVADKGVSIEKALKQGPEIGSALSDGITLATGKRSGAEDAPWCAIYIAQVTVPPAVRHQPAQPAVAGPTEELAPTSTALAVGLVEPEAPVTDKPPENSNHQN